MKYIILIIGLVFLAGCNDEEINTYAIDADDDAIVQIDSGDINLNPGTEICSECQGFDYSCEVCEGDGLE